MKKFLLSTFVLFTFAALNAQYNLTPNTTVCESFTTAPAGWTLSQGASFNGYNNYWKGCASDNGIVTPGVGGNNPANILTAGVTTSLPGSKVLVQFSIAPYASNLSCNSFSAAFECTTLLDIYITPTSYNSTTIPTGNNLLGSYVGFALTNAGNYAIVVSLPSNVTSFKVLFRFGAQNNCNQGGTKYILDDFCFQQTSCTSSTCPPVANDDAFVLPTNDKNQLFKADLTGGSLQFLPLISGYGLYSLPSGPGNNSVDNGVDYDAFSSIRSVYTWSLISQGTAAAYGTVTVNADGTFSYQRNGLPVPSQTTVSFTYKMTNNSDPSLYDDATVYITLPSNASLPVLFKSFNAVQSNGKVALTWETAQEINNKEFQVQRRNATGGFETIATIPSKALNGNSAQVLAYSYDDLDNLNGKGQMYYRIKQVDINTHADYSETRSIRNNAKNVNITVYPNPGRDLVKVTIPDGVGLVDVSVSDMSGKEVKRWNSTGAKNIELTNLRPGLYTIRVNIKESGDMLVNKLIIQ